MTQNYCNGGWRPNSRKDYHYNESEEFFYQLQGDICVQVQYEGKALKYR